MKYFISFLIAMMFFAAPVNDFPVRKPFIFAIATVNPYQKSRNGPTFISSDYNGNKDEWAKKTFYRIHQYGFNAVGAWSDSSLNTYIPHTKCLSLYSRANCDISSPEWADKIETIVREHVTPNDDLLIGYYLDNEMDWDTLKPYAKKYFITTCGLIRKYDKNHLILGVRFNHSPPKSVLEASNGFVDVHSLNVYSDSPHIPIDIISYIHLTTGVPIIISEFSFYAKDNRSGDKNIYGFGGYCNTQSERANKMFTFVSELENIPYVIGCEWFQWNDEPPNGRYDGEDCNFGIVDIYDQPYPEMLNTLKMLK